MSGKSVKDLIPESTENLITDDDKLYENSRTDSGFISSGNLLLSEENIISEEFKSGPTDWQDSGTIEEKPEGMYVDSGVVCLSENFSNLSLSNPNLNNLSSDNCSSDKNKKPTETKPETADENTWKIYCVQDEDGDTYLHMAIIQGYVHATLNLIRAAPHSRLLDTPNDEAVTPLHLSVATGQWQVTRWLITAGARPGPRNLRGDSPLHMAARQGNVPCCKAILDPVQYQERADLGLQCPPQPNVMYDLEQWNCEGQTCVHVAALQGNIEVLRHLVLRGANINAREGKSGYTALHLAVEREDEKLISFLLNECNTLNVESVTYGGRSALQLGLEIKPSLDEALRRRGVPSPYTTDESSEDSEDEVSYENIYMPSMVNASA